MACLLNNYISHVSTGGCMRLLHFSAL